MILLAWEAISDCFTGGRNQGMGSIAEHRYMDQLEIQCLDLWLKISTQTVLSEQFKAYLDQNSN